ncbi:hypothetical protein L520_1655 [Bordetella bronchiseptica MBORD681]|nr:hypothetical protein L520_1655 [Bordetella bronchiseptica MBORD681]KDD03437.1 hypothetical protein L521_1858 [Bordetella bronchiseptica MBORD698]
MVLETARYETWMNAKCGCKSLYVPIRKEWCFSCNERFHLFARHAKLCCCVICGLLHGFDVAVRLAIKVHFENWRLFPVST